MVANDASGEIEGLEFGLYDQYVIFQRELADIRLKFLRGGLRRLFKKNFSVLDRKQFWTWYGDLGSLEQEEHRRQFEMGYAKLSESRIADSRRTVGRMANFGVSPEVQRVIDIAEGRIEPTPDDIARPFE